MNCKRTNVIGILLLFLLSPLGSTLAQSNYGQDILKERQEFKAALLDSTGIINVEEQNAIQELAYFPIDSSWVLTAKFEKSKGKVFEMPTTTKRLPRYRKIGYLHFEKDGVRFRLTAFQSLDLKGKEYKNYVFIPFKDGNAPETTYGGGRYLDVNFKTTVKAVTVDFNAAYNPYCVYSNRYSCPITPEENHVDIKINAGVKNPIMIREY